MNGIHQTDLHRLTYLSSTSNAMPRGELDDILETARANNSRHQLTGLLIYHDQQFFQTLEGPAAPVQQIFVKIKRDLRHNGCLVLESCPVAVRLFDRWSMAYKSVGELSDTQKQTYVDLTGVRDRCAGSEATGDARTRVLVDSFLSSLRDVELA